MCDASHLSAMVDDLRRLSNALNQDLAPGASKLGEHKAVVATWWRSVNDQLTPILEGFEAYMPVQKLLNQPQAATAGKKKK